MRIAATTATPCAVFRAAAARIVAGSGRVIAGTAARAGRVIVAGVVAGAGLVAAASAAPFAPRSAIEIVERLPARSGAEWREIDSLRAALATQPADAATAARLASRYRDLYRVEGDPRLVGFAEAVLEPWRAAAEAPHEIALELAAVAQTRHRFDEALARLDSLLARDPRAAEGWLMRASLAQVVGRYAEARRSCARLVVLADGLTAGACLAAVDAITGRSQDARTFFANALHDLDGSAAVDATTWIATLAAETAAASGRAAEADEHFRAAFTATRRARQAPSIYLLAAYADFLLATDRARDALALLQDAPRNDSTLLRVAAAKQRLGLDTAAVRADLEYRLQLTLAGQSPEHGREAAYFLVRVTDEPRRALALAAASFAVQREPLDAELVLEAAAGACGLDATAAAAAAPVLEWLEANAVEHVRLRALAERLGECS